MSPAGNLGRLSGSRREILSLVKRRGVVTVAATSEELGISYEGARQHLLYLEQQGWLEHTLDRESGSAGRPTHIYRLTTAGEELFPKTYSLLTVELLDALVESFGEKGLKRVLARLTDEQVERWRSRLAGRSLDEKLERLRDLYLDDDPYMEVEQTPTGLRLVERNCPFLEVARERPALCSVTVRSLERLLGVRVVREERFQTDHGRCAFRILTGSPLPDSSGFELEPPPA